MTRSILPLPLLQSSDPAHVFLDRERCLIVGKYKASRQLHTSPTAMDKQKTASCIGVRAGGIRRSARIRAAKTVDLGTDSGVPAVEVGKFVAAEERSDQAPRPWECEDGGTTRNARISVAKPVDLGIDPGVLAAGVEEFVAAAERRQPRGPCKSENEAMMRGARISVAGPVDLGIDPGLLAVAVAELVADAQRGQASRRPKRCTRARPTRASSGCRRKKSQRGTKTAVCSVSWRSS